MDFSDIIREAGKTVGRARDDVVPATDFVESRIFGLGVDLYPVQRVVLKAHYGIPLDEARNDLEVGDLLEFPHGDLLEMARAERPNIGDGVDSDELANIICRTGIMVRNWRGEHLSWMSEADYIRWLHSEGRCNINEIKEGEERKELVLVFGRRAGKTLLASCIIAYETYKLVKKVNPHQYYGIVESNPFQLISVATDKDQAGLLYSEVSTHFGNCEFFRPYQANSTETYAKFQTPVDQEKFGLFSENKHARRSIKVTFRPCVAKGLRGAGNIVVVLDEVAHFVDNSNQQSAGAIYEAVHPSLAAFSPKHPRNKGLPIGPSDGRMVLISSPLGKYGLFYELFDSAMRSGRASDIFAMQAPTWEVNPTIDSGFFRNSYAKDARKFYQEFGASFTDKTKAWIEEPQDLYDCIDPDLRPKTQGVPGVAYFLGVDVGIKKDATALAVGHYDSSEQRIVLDYIGQKQVGDEEHEPVDGEEESDRLDFGEILDWIVDVCRRFRVVEGMFDQEQGLALEHLIRRKGLKQVRMERMTEALNSEMYSSFKSLMYDRRVRLFDHPIQQGHQHADYVEQMCELQAEYKSKYKVKVFAPKRAGCHDDYADALVRMVYLASKRLGKHGTVTTVKKGVFALAGPGSKFGTRSAHRFRSYGYLGGSHPSRQDPTRRRSTISKRGYGGGSHRGRTR